MSMMPNNPRAVAGNNEAPDYAKEVTDRLAEEYGKLNATVTGLLNEARDAPEEVADDATMGILAKLIVRFRDAANRLEAMRVSEKQAFLRGGEGVDQFFFALVDKCLRRDRKNRPGAADILQSRLDAYQQRKLAEEQARRRREAEETARLAREARNREEAERRAAEEARVAAERARKPETAEAKGVAAVQQESIADAAGVDAALATGQAEEAHIATLARPADMVRTRVESGPLVTMATEPYAVVEDAAQLDAIKLWPFVTLDAKEKALRAWARNTGFTQQMAGASIGKRPKSVVR